MHTTCKSLIKCQKFTVQFLLLSPDHFLLLPGSRGGVWAHIPKQWQIIEPIIDEYVRYFCGYLDEKAK